MRFIEKCNQGKETLLADDPLTVLTKFELTNKDTQVTNAAFLLFAEREVFQATIELGRFSSPTSIKDGLTVRSDLFTEVEEVLAFIRKHINKEYIITGDPQREERWQYPMTAIREIVTNMIVHRDYMDYGDSSIKIFDDYIEFFNPGRLPESISIEQLLTDDYSSYARNRKIAATFKEAQFIEKYGSGIKRIRESFSVYGLKAPKFENFQHGFRVMVYTEKATSAKMKEGIKEGIKEGVKEGENLSSNQLKIVHAMVANRKITLPELAEIVGINEANIQKNIKKLRDWGTVKRIGPAKGGYWEVSGE